MSELTLYGRTSCPYCAKVLRFMQSRNIEIPLKDTTNPENREELIRIGGKGQVPCLVIDGKALYESMDIIDWLQNNYAQ